MSQSLKMLFVGTVLGVSSLVASQASFALTINGGRPVNSSVKVIGSGIAASENRAAVNFNAIEANGGSTITITQGTEEKLVVEADDNILQYLTTTVANGKLRIGVRQGISLLPKTPIKYTLSLINLNNLSLNGAVQANVPAGLNTDTLALDSNGASGIDIIGLSANALNASINGASVVNLSGDVDSQVVTVTGASNYNACPMTSRDANVTAAGVANATVSASTSLGYTVTGLSRLNYVGEPKLSGFVSSMDSLQKLAACSL